MVSDISKWESWETVYVFFNKKNVHELEECAKETKSTLIL